MYNNFFSKIDSKDKAYWLGFLYADGYISKENRRLCLSLSIKDEDQMDRFISAIGYSTDAKKYYGPYKTSGKRVQLDTTDRDLARDLVNLGCVNKKSLICRLPELGCRELDLAFLLGYFDGDGTQYQASLTSGSKSMLLDIKERFSVSFDVIEDSVFRLRLGAKLFDEMISNYTDSMPRKRVKNRPPTEKYLLDHLPKEEWLKKNRKFSIQKGDLEKLVWEIPSEEIAKMYGVSGTIVCRRCRQLGIKKPGKGYWTRINIENGSYSPPKYSKK